MHRGKTELKSELYSPAIGSGIPLTDLNIYSFLCYWNEPFNGFAFCKTFCYISLALIIS